MHEELLLKSGALFFSIINPIILFSTSIVQSLKGNNNNLQLYLSVTFQYLDLRFCSNKVILAGCGVINLLYFSLYFGITLTPQLYN